jgi:prevent-host-death family protein
MIDMRVSSTDLQKNLDQYLREVTKNEPLTITQHGKVVASIVSCSDELHLGEGEAAYQTEPGYVSYQAYLELTEKSEERFELIDGELYLLASPAYAHQSSLSELFGTFYSWFKGKSCRPLFAPFDVTLIKSETNINVVQPDILVICDTEKIDANGKYRGVPTLVVEVLSPSTRNKDMTKKLNLYQQTGVREYWLIDPDQRTAHQYVFADQSITMQKTYVGDTILQSACFPGLSVKLKELFI